MDELTNKLSQTTTKKLIATRGIDVINWKQHTRDNLYIYISQHQQQRKHVVASSPSANVFVYDPMFLLPCLSTALVLMTDQLHIYLHHASL